MRRQIERFGWWVVLVASLAAIEIYGRAVPAADSPPVAAATSNTDALPAPSDHRPRIGPAGREAVLAYRMKNYVGPELKIGNGYVDGGHAMKIQRDGQVSSYREILTVDRTRDAELRKELQYARSAELQKLNPLDRATRLARHVAAMYTPKEGRHSLEAKTDVLDTKYRNQEVLVGNITKITGGAGVCRHRSLMYKLLADEAGLHVSLVRGLYGRHPATAGFHAWNELHLSDGQVLIVDTTNPQPDFHFPGLHSKQAVRYLTSGREPMYPAAKPQPQPKTQPAAAATTAK